MVIMKHNLWLRSALLTVALASLGSASQAQEVPAATVRELIANEDRAGLADLLSRGTVSGELSQEETLLARLLLTERLATLSTKDSESRQKVARSLIALFPDDSFVQAIAASERVQFERPVAEAVNEQKVASVPAAFQNALDQRSAERVFKMLNAWDFADALSPEQKEAAESLVLDYVRPIPASNIQENIVGYAVLSKLAPENRQYTDKLNQYEAALDQRRSAILGRMKRKPDEFSGRVFYEHPNEPPYANSRTYLTVYAVQSSDFVNLRMRLNYTDDDWLFVSRAVFNIDGRMVTFPGGNWERDNNHDIWEWIDVPVSGDVRTILEQIAASKKTIVRFQGQQYYDDEVIRDSDKQIIRDMFLVEEILKGRQ
jgi:hypothetical protein